jgi:anthranilate synthase component 2
MSVLLIDNYDSFTHNLARYMRELGRSVTVLRNDAVTLSEIEKLAPSHIVISPGPCTPERAGISLEVVRRFSGWRPILGVCLGHQCIGQAFGGRVVRAGHVMHGKTSPVTHEGSGLFVGLPSPFRVTRYHSLIVEQESLRTLEVGDERRQRHHGARPSHAAGRKRSSIEAVLTEHGHRLLENFLAGSPSKIYLNDRLLDPAGPHRSRRSWPAVGRQLFETLRAYGGPLPPGNLGGWQQLPFPRPSGPALGEIASGVSAVLAVNELAEASIRITLTRGVGPRGLLAPPDTKPTLMIAAFPLPPSLPRAMSACMVGIRRNEHSPLSQLKSLAYLDNILALREADAAGCDEAILLNTVGRIAGGSRSNLF